MIVELTYFEINIRKVVEVGGVVDGLDLHGDGGGPLADVVPVDALEPAAVLDILQVPDPLVHLVTEPEGGRGGKDQSWSNIYSYNL